MVALAIHKLSLPIRVPCTVVSIPVMHKLLTKLGLLKPFELIVSKLTMGKLTGTGTILTENACDGGAGEGGAVPMSSKKVD